MEWDFADAGTGWLSSDELRHMSLPRTTRGGAMLEPVSTSKFDLDALWPARVYTAAEVLPSPSVGKEGEEGGIDDAVNHAQNEKKNNGDEVNIHPPPAASRPKKHMISYVISAQTWTESVKIRACADTPMNMIMSLVESRDISYFNIGGRRLSMNSTARSLGFPTALQVNLEGK